MEMDSVPPIVSNADAQAALNQVASVPGGQPMVRVVRAWKLLQVAGAMFDAGTITEAEYGKFHAFYFRCTAMAAGFQTVPRSSVAAGSGGGEPPEWFLPAMEEVLQPFKDAMEPKVDIPETNSKARMMNARATNLGDVLKPIFCEVKRERYDPFPPYLASLEQMDKSGRRNFLQFYGLPVDGDDQIQLSIIKKFIGVQV